MEQTVIFLDVDGVLNVGIHDEKGAPLLFRDKDVRLAQKLMKQGYRGPEAHCMAKLTSLALHPLGHGEKGNYDMLRTKDGAQLSDVLVGRFAELVRFAGDNCRIVLSSSWRRPHHLKRRVLLEEAISRHLGKSFEFTEMTATDREERHPADRLETIGDHLAELCSKGQVANELRVLVLEDFFISAMNGWLCGGKEMDSVSAAEEYLAKRAMNVASGPTVSVKLYHCYDEITTNSGVSMRVGKGFSDKFLTEAKAFIVDGAAKPVGRSLTEESSCSTRASDGGETPPCAESVPAVHRSSKEREKSFFKRLSAVLVDV